MQQRNLHNWLQDDKKYVTMAVIDGVKWQTGNDGEKAHNEAKSVIGRLSPRRKLKSTLWARVALEAVTMLATIIMMSP